MIAQRPPDAAPAIIATAEALPLADDGVDAAMAVLTDHHWSDRARGLAEMRRVARRRAVVFQHDPVRRGTASGSTREYLPTFLRRLRGQGARGDDAPARRRPGVPPGARSRTTAPTASWPRTGAARTPTSTRSVRDGISVFHLLPARRGRAGGRAAAGRPRQRRLGATPRRPPRPRRARPRLPRDRRRVRLMPALIFDLDGTLVDTVYAHVFAWQRALAERGMAIDGWRIHRRIGMSGGLFTRAVGRELGRDARRGRGPRAAGPPRRAVPRDAARAPPAARRAGAARGAARRAASSTGSRRPGGGRRSTPRSTCSACPADTVVVQRGDVARAKPEPDLFLECARRLGVDADGLLRRRRRGLGPARRAPRADAQHRAAVGRLRRRRAHPRRRVPRLPRRRRAAQPRSTSSASRPRSAFSACRRRRGRSPSAARGRSVS